MFPQDLMPERRVFQDSRTGEEDVIFVTDDDDAVSVAPRSAGASAKKVYDYSKESGDLLEDYLIQE